MPDSSTFIPVEPFEIVVFGGTGDLARRKILPALYHRFRDGQIPETSKIVGASRSEHSREEYLEIIREGLFEFSGREDYDEESWDRFAAIVDYVAVDALDEDEGWKELAKALPDSDLQRIFYLATPPAIYIDIAKNLHGSGVANDRSRIVLEKPIGNDLESARRVNDGVGKYFAEDRIYRIDHFLGKETVQNLLVLRFANILFEPLWSRDAIDHIQITAAENIGVGGRGGYYDKSGALRDMVQNHLMQLLCLTCMEVPASLAARDVRIEKLKVIHALKPIDAATIADTTVRGQYARGTMPDGHKAKDYLTDADAEESSTESYVAIRAEVDNWRWSGVPIYMRTGKRMTERRSEIVIQFKSVPHSVFGGATPVNPNKLVIRLQPDEAVQLWVEIKEPGAGGMRLKTLPLNLTYADNFTVRYPDAYERLLMDVVRGNLSLFMSRDEVHAAWEWVDGILEAWEATNHRMELYPAGTMGPEEASDLLAKADRAWADQVAPNKPLNTSANKPVGKADSDTVSEAAQ